MIARGVLLQAGLWNPDPHYNGDTSLRVVRLARMLLFSRFVPRSAN